MKKDSIEILITNATKQLLDLARKSCWNKISDNCSYIISEIPENPFQGNLTEKNRIRKNENEKKNPLNLSELIPELENFYQNIYDLNFFIYKSTNSQTIIEIQYYPKSFLENELKEKVKDSKPMIHCKVSIPPYITDSKEEFDINWELGNLREKWNMFSLKRKLKREFKKNNVW